MGRILVILSLVLSVLAGSAVAQNYKPKYAFPVEGVPVLYTANFGELRASHFHAGVDIKTDGVEGKNIISVDDGYVSRIAYSAYGYGLALYIAHKDGTTAVYAHMQRFRDDINEYVDKERRRLKQSNVNLYPPASMFLVKQGEVIGLSGNTGSSGGPHLHFEIRESASQRPTNPLLNRMLAANDNIAPTLAKLHYIEVDTLSGVVQHAPTKSYSLTKGEDGAYVVDTQDSLIWVGRKGYFVIEGVDRKNGVSNIYALTKVDGYIDQKHYFSYLMDGFSFSNTRYRNGVTHYTLKESNRNEVIRLAQMQGSTKEHYGVMVNNGLIYVNEGQQRQLRIDVEDDMGNCSSVSVVLKGAKASFTAKPQSGEPVYYNRDYSFRGEGIAVSIPKGSLYESTYFHYKRDSSSTLPSIKSLSDIYTVMERTTPLHSYINVSIAVDSIPANLRSKCGVATTTSSGKPLFIGGEYKNGVITARTRSLGAFFIMADTVAPYIRSRFKSDADLKDYDYVSFDISDNLSGTREYNATLDGEWIPLDLKGGVLRYNFREKVDGEPHKIVITAVDGCGNVKHYTYNFTR